MCASTAWTWLRSATGRGQAKWVDVMPPSDAVLVLNAGSSSIKFGLFDISAAEPVLLCKGFLDEHEAKPRLVVKSPTGEDLFETRRETADADGGHLFADVLGFVEDRFGDHRLRAVGHRVVHG